MTEQYRKSDANSDESILNTETSHPTMETSHNRKRPKMDPKIQLHTDSIGENCIETNSESTSNIRQLVAIERGNKSPHFVDSSATSSENVRFHYERLVEKKNDKPALKESQSDPSRFEKQPIDIQSLASTSTLQSSGCPPVSSMEGCIAHSCSLT